MDEKQSSLAQGLYRNLRILAVSTVVFLVVLALAPFKWHNSEWRDVQSEYNRRARAAGLPPMTAGLHQIWRPEVDVTDRCTTCHVGMGAAAPLVDGGPLYGKHPAVGHDVARMGCTVCHRGQGRATTEMAAHGEVRHWEDPMLPREHLEAGCGPCHGDALHIPSLAQVERGRYLFELNGCHACHKVDGVGGDVGPDLSGVGLKGFDRAWHVRHLRDPVAVVEGSRMMSFGHLRDDEINDILTYLDTLIGAPQLVRGKALATELGCRGCHKIGGLGGDLGIDLAEAAAKPADEHSFDGVRGEHTLANWQREHLRRPQEVAPGSTMPAYDLQEDDETALVTYILSLRRPDVPLEELPRSTVLAHLNERRDFEPTGEAIFGAFCAACHGRDGRGQAVESLATTVPDLRNPESHAVMSEESLRYVLANGRPGRFMPALGEKGAGLRPEEIDALVGYLRRDLPKPPAWNAVSTEMGNGARSLGERTYRLDCAACHGAAGEGTVIAPSLNSPELHYVASDAYFYETITRGRPGTAMPAHRGYNAETVAGLIEHLRGLAVRGDGGSPPRSPQGDAEKMLAQVRRVLGVRDLESYQASGSPAYGELLYRSYCRGCHGADGRGGIAPAIANPAFLRAASDGFLAGTVVLGRRGKAMQSFGPRGLARLEGREVGDLIVYLRHLAAQERERPGYATVQGTPSRGRDLYEQYCIGCHGVDGRGSTAPALANPAFLDAVPDGFLQATMVKGRPGTPMRSWARGGFGFAELEPEDINDIVSYIRSWHNAGSKN